MEMARSPNRHSNTRGFPVPRTRFLEGAFYGVQARGCVVCEKIRGPLSHLLAIRANFKFSQWMDKIQRKFAEFEKPNNSKVGRGELTEKSLGQGFGLFLGRFRKTTDRGPLVDATLDGGVPLLDLNREAEKGVAIGNHNSKHPIPMDMQVKIYLHSHGTSLTPVVELDEKYTMAPPGPRPMLLAVIERCCAPNNPRLHAYIDTTFGLNQWGGVFRKRDTWITKSSSSRVMSEKKCKVEGEVREENGLSSPRKSRTVAKREGVG
ncbi:hypothetical protein EI94DRAFT_1784770 [Lactarius quietus]|nr:hypothetical protein EI94DRAFT_1784770 [Lactarius quietus]